MFNLHLKELLPVAKSGYATSQYLLGTMYANGKRILQNYKQAVKWYKKAANQGNANAQYNLGIMYIDGNGVLKDMKKAAYWIEQAYNNGNSGAADIWKKYKLYNYK